MCHPAPRPVPSCELAGTRWLDGTTRLRTRPRREAFELRLAGEILRRPLGALVAEPGCFGERPGGIHEMGTRDRNEVCASRREDSVELVRVRDGTDGDGGNASLLS